MGRVGGPNGLSGPIGGAHAASLPGTRTCHYSRMRADTAEEDQGNAHAIPHSGHPLRSMLFDTRWSSDRLRRTFSHTGR